MPTATMTLMSRTRLKTGLPLPLIVLGLAAFLMLSAGCNDPVAKIRTQHRQERIARWLNYCEAHEADGGRRVRNTLDTLKSLHELNVQRTEQLPARLAQWIARDERDWQERAPRYEARFGKILGGDPERARRTAIVMIH